ncbi:MAG: phosphodiesterase [Gammaproteobacteria bacterium]|nr:phosphodiesterase [Gammaproteobacteria bacterium]MCP5138178.1 phosphodiesterase [Gammaproteobacteria bacterium]
MSRIQRVVQITDTHLFSDPSRALKGIVTDASLRAVLAAAHNDLVGADLLLLTGDLAHDEVEATYQRLRATLAALIPGQLPVRAIPGNHDDPALMIRHFGQADSVVLGDWLCLSLDSHRDGQVEGTLRASELQRLDRELAETRASHALIAVHHHPVDVGSLWMDGIGLSNHAALFEVLNRHDKARAILNGHIHQEFEGGRDGIAVYGTPSTNVQFRARSDEPQFADLEPGYRRLALYPDGRIDTEVVRVPGVVCNLNDEGSYE